MAEFSDKVYAAVQGIPRGFVATYGDVARAIGRPQSARYVGYALHNNPSPGDTIPCHRVVFADGSLAPGFAFGGPQAQRKLLASEGVAFIDDTHVDLEHCHYPLDGSTSNRPNDIDWAAEMASY